MENWKHIDFLHDDYRFVVDYGHCSGCGRDAKVWGYKKKQGQGTLWWHPKYGRYCYTCCVLLAQSYLTR